MGLPSLSNTHRTGAVFLFGGSGPSRRPFPPLSLRLNRSESAVDRTLRCPALPASPASITGWLNWPARPHLLDLVISCAVAAPGPCRRHISLRFICMLLHSLSATHCTC